MQPNGKSGGIPAAFFVHLIRKCPLGQKVNFLIEKKLEIYYTQEQLQVNNCVKSNFKWLMFKKEEYIL